MSKNNKNNKNTKIIKLDTSPTTYYNKKIYCGNCGKIGHIYKQCNFPIISLGILLYRITDNGREYLLVMRKDSLGYVEIIRGNYPLNDLEYLTNIVDVMTLSEKEKLLTQPFSKLWNELWAEDEEKKIKYQKEFYNSEKYFNILKEGVTIDNEFVNIQILIKNSNTKWKNPEWGFPKGRRNLKEKDLQCAVREFEEETDITRDDIYVLKCIDPLDEDFIGSNKKPYRHIYYIAKLINDIGEPAINQERKIQVIEIGDIKWLTLNEALKCIRSYNKEKKNILREADSLIESIETMNVIPSHY